MTDADATDISAIFHATSDQARMGFQYRLTPRFILFPLAGCLAEAKKPEDGQDYDDQTDNIDKSIHDLSRELSPPVSAGGPCSKKRRPQAPRSES